MIASLHPVGRARACPPARSRPSRARPGFTLVELLVAITIVGILAGLAMAGLHTAREQARVARTNSTILKLHNLVVDMYDTYSTRRAPINTTGMSPSAAAAARLRAIRALMLTEMPQCPNDVSSSALSTLLTTAGIPRPALSQAYERRYNLGPPSVKYNMAEIFYMWVTISNPEARGQFADNEVADTDGDGWPEFVDAWGNPILFLRWAPGFLRSSGADTNLQTGDATNDHDPLDPYRVDAGAWRMVPLIYSAGPDGIYDIMPANTTAGAAYDMNNPYAAPIAVGTPRDLPNESRTAEGPANGSLDHADNIHNHRLEAR